MNKMTKECYENRELSWLKFNERVLEEAEDETNPLCERLKLHEQCELSTMCMMT